MTISNGGVLPRIHPELLSKKRGGRVKVDTQVTVPEKREARVKSIKKPSIKKGKGKPGRKARVSSGFLYQWFPTLVLRTTPSFESGVLEQGNISNMQDRVP